MHAASASTSPPGSWKDASASARARAPWCPRGAAARAEFWKNWFEDPERRPLTPVTITDVTVNGRPAKQLTVFLNKGDGRPFRQQEV
jgi:hypothetical protein